METLVLNLCKRIKLDAGAKIRSCPSYKRDPNYDIGRALVEVNHSERFLSDKDFVDAKSLVKLWYHIT